MYIFFSICLRTCPHHVTQSDLELGMFQPPPTKYWDCSHVPLSSAQNVCF